MNLLRRGVAYSIDLIIISAILQLYLFCFGTPAESGSGYTASRIELLLIVLGWYIYFVFFEYRFNTTPGKAVFRLRVVRENGEKPILFDILKRRSLDMIELVFIVILAPIMVLATDKQQRLGDLIAKTTVVQKVK